MKELGMSTMYIPVEYVVATTIVVISLVGLVLKLAPKGVEWFNKVRTKANQHDEIIKTVKNNSDDIDLINQKMGRDYARLNKIEQSMERQQAFMEESLEERELILRSLLGVIQGLQEIGANGPTKKAESEIQLYLLRKSHETQRDTIDN